MASNSVLSLGLCLLAQVGWAQVVIPVTPAGENLTAMLEALNSRDRQSIENYAERYGGSGSVDQVLGTIEQIGELRIASVVESDRLRIAFVAEAPAIGLRFVGMLAVEDSEPPVLAYSLPWTVLPPDKTVIGFAIDDERFDVALPWARVVNPITGSNWEGSGVQPDVAVPADEALTTALELIRRQSP